MAFSSASSRANDQAAVSFVEYGFHLAAAIIATAMDDLQATPTKEVSCGSCCVPLHPFNKTREGSLLVDIIHNSRPIKVLLCLTVASHKPLANVKDFSKHIPSASVRACSRRVSATEVRHYTWIHLRRSINKVKVAVTFHQRCVLPFVVV